jgi:hypothetical protein
MEWLKASCNSRQLFIMPAHQVHQSQIRQFICLFSTTTESALFLNSSLAQRSIYVSRVQLQDSQNGESRNIAKMPCRSKFHRAHKFSSFLLMLPNNMHAQSGFSVQFLSVHQVHRISLANAERKNHSSLIFTHASQPHSDLPQVPVTPS